MYSGSTWGQPGVNLGPTRGQSGINLGSIWGQSEVNLHCPTSTASAGMARRISSTLEASLSGILIDSLDQSSAFSYGSSISSAIITGTQPTIV